MRAFIATLAFSAYAGIASALDLSSCPTGGSQDATPNILSITVPSVGQTFPAGKAFDITWTDHSDIQKVALVLCKGPATNCVPNTCITPTTNNNGKYSYTPDSALEASQGQGYGIKIIAVGGAQDGHFQYSPQFGISNSSPHSWSPSAPVSSASPASPASPAKPVSQIADGQVQVPTNNPQPTKSLPKFTSSGSAGTGLYYVPAPTGKVSNITHSSGFKFSYGPNTAPAGALINSTQFLSITPGVNPAPTGVLPVTSVAFATATPNGPLNPSVAPTATGVVTSPSNAAGKVVVGGLVAGLGAVAALVL